jgi:hypothetical protein
MLSRECRMYAQIFIHYLYVKPNKKFEEEEEEEVVMEEWN